MNNRKLCLLLAMLVVFSLLTTQCVPPAPPETPSTPPPEEKPLPKTYTFTDINFPGAIWTELTEINNKGQVVGDYSLTQTIDAGTAVSSFMWSLDSTGELRTSGAPTSFTSPQGPENTSPLGMNDRGQIVGWFYDESGSGHGYVRSADGESFETIDHPNAVIETAVLGINNNGDISGFYIDGNEQVHGFMRSADGKFIDIDHPDAAGKTFATRIDDFGHIIGFVRDDSGTQSFLRSPDGEFSTFKHPLAAADGTSCAQSLNARGEIAGFYTTEDGMYHGFVRSADGSEFNTIDHPKGTGGTMVYGLNDVGQVVGLYTDDSGATHGFVATPES